MLFSLGFGTPPPGFASFDVAPTPGLGSDGIDASLFDFDIPPGALSAEPCFGMEETRRSFSPSALVEEGSGFTAVS